MTRFRIGLGIAILNFAFSSIVTAEPEFYPVAQDEECKNQDWNPTPPYPIGWISLVLPLVLDRAAAEEESDEKPKCLISDLTRDCAIFYKPGNKNGIRFADGTFIPIYQNNSPDESHGMIEQVSRERDLQLKVQARVLRALQGVSEPPISETFQLGILGVIRNPSVQKALSDSLDQRNHEPEPLLLPWPPDKEEASIQNVSVDDLREFFQELPKGARQEIRSAIGLIGSSGQSPQHTENVGSSDSSSFKPEKRMERLKTLFNYAKNALLDEILKGVSLAQASEEQRSQYERVRSINLNEFGFSSSLPSCAGSAPDAFFSPGNNTVTVCPSYLTFPDSSLIAMLGHELAHGIDPCNQQFPLVKLNKERLARLSSAPAGSPDETQNDPELRNAVENLNKNAASPFATVNLRTMFLKNGERPLEYFKSNGIFEVLTKGIEPARSPIRKTYECLVKEVGVRETKKSDLRDATNKYLRAVTEMGTLKTESRIIRARINSVLSRYPQCVRVTSPSQMLEAMSDAWGSKVLGRWLQDNPPRTEEEKMAPLGHLLSDYCSQKMGKAGASINGTYVRQAEELLKVSTESQHPFARLRADQIVLTEPRIQKALGCRPSKAPSCTKYLGTVGDKPVGPPTVPHTVQSVK